MKPITTAAMILLLAMAAGADDKKAAMLIQAAEAKETIQGDLKAAIELYGQAAKEAGPNRSLAAKSLLRMAECYQKTGNAEARKIYEQVVREYGDQKEAVAEARARLGGPDRAAAETGVASRQRWTMPSGGQIFGLISADGRYLPYTNWRDKADLFLHDMSSGSNRRITDDGDGGNLFAGEAVLSRDDSQIAFSFYGSDHFEIRLASLEGTGVPKAKVIYTNPDLDSIRVQDWSPDLQHLAISVRRKDKTGQIALLSLADGSYRPLKSTDWRGPKRVLFSPDGKYLAFDIPASDVTNGRDIYVLAVDGKSESVIAPHPAQDLLASWTPDGKHLLFRSDRTGSMSLWSIAVAGGKAQGDPELIRPDLPGETAGITSSGALYSNVSAPRFHGGMISDIELADFDFARDKLVAGPTMFVQEFIGANAFPDWSSDGKRIAYITRPSMDAPWIVIRDVDSGRVIRQFEPKVSIYVGAGIRWSPDGRAFVAQGTDAKGRRGIYRIDAETGDAAPIAVESGEQDSPEFALANWSADGKRVYYARNVRRKGQPDEMSLMERDLASGTERAVISRRRADFNLNQWALSPDGRYAVAIGHNPATGKMEGILIPIAGGEPRYLGGTFFMWSPESRSVFVRKADSAVWRISVDDGGAQPIAWRPEIATQQNQRGIRLARPSPDGRHLALMVTAPPKPEEVWSLENFLPSATSHR